MGISCLIFIGCLIYTEIIIIKCFGMNRFTKKEIKKRATLDNQMIYQLGKILVEENEEI